MTTLILICIAYVILSALMALIVLAMIDGLDYDYRLFGPKIISSSSDLKLFFVVFVCYMVTAWYIVFLVIADWLEEKLNAFGKQIEKIDKRLAANSEAFYRQTTS